MKDIREHLQWRNKYSKRNRHHSLNKTTGRGSTYFEEINNNPDNIWEGVLCWIRPDDEIRVGDEITTTTSSFSFDCLTGTFDKEAKVPVEVTAEHIGEDYSEFKPKLCRDGGCYGFDHWRVLAIEEAYQ